MRVVCTSIFGILALSATTAADVQHADICLEPSEPDIYGVEEIAVDANVMAMGYDTEVYIFQNSPAGWTEQETIVPNHDVSSLDLSGDTLIIGDKSDDEELGCAYIYRLSDGVWTQQQKLIPSKPIPSEESVINYGNSVATDGTWAMIGPCKSESGVCLFKFDGQLWTEVGYLPAQLGIPSFGFDLALDGNRLLIGSRGNDARGWVYRLDNEVWGQEAELLPQSGNPAGTEVSLSGNLAILGSSELKEPSGEWSSFATIFRRSGSQWTEEELPQLPTFGDDVAIDNDLAVVSSGDNEEALREFYVFQHNGLLWNHTKTLRKSTQATYASQCVLVDRTAFLGIDGNVCVFEDVYSYCLDIDGDNTVGEAELHIVMDAWGTSDTNADMNNDGLVDIADLLAILSAWGPCP